MRVRRVGESDRRSARSSLFVSQAEYANWQLSKKSYPEKGALAGQKADDRSVVLPIVSSRTEARNFSLKVYSGRVRRVGKAIGVLRVPLCLFPKRNMPTGN